MMEKYEKLEKIGEGTYGKVYKAKDKETGQLVALKKTKVGLDREGIPRSYLREISLLKLLSHSTYIVRLISVEHVNNKHGKPVLYLVFEYLDTDLHNYIRSYLPPGPPHLIKNLLYQLCKGVDHCHSHGVLHRDLKPQNILMDMKNGILKIADLGLGRTFSLPMKSYTHKIVTLWYRAPEILLGQTHYSIGVDMWSVGCIFAEMSRGNAFFRGDSEFQQLVKIFCVLGTPTEESFPGVTSLPGWHEYPQWEPRKLENYVPDMDALGVDLLSKMFKYNHAKRISAREALNHPYFDTLDKSQF